MLVKEKTFKYIKTEDDLIEAAKYLRWYLDNSKNKKLSLDLETYALIPDLDEAPRPINRYGYGYEGTIKSIQIGIPHEVEDIQFIFDFEEIDNPELFIKELKPIIESATIIGQNLKYDYEFLYQILGIEMKKMRDTMLISQVLMAGDKIQHNLSALYKEYINKLEFKVLTSKTLEEYEDFKRKYQKITWRGELDDSQQEYAADDVRLVHYLYDSLCSKIDEFIGKYQPKGPNILTPIVNECNLIPVVAEMELWGIKLDVNYLRGFVIPLLESKKEEAINEVGKYFKNTVEKSNGKRGKERKTWTEEEPINIGSWQQVKKSLLSVGVDVPNTTEETLEQYEHLHESIKYILQYKKVNTYLTKYGENLIDYCDYKGIIHAHWFQIGRDDGAIDTSRMSCKNPPLQTIPARGDDIFGYKATELFRKMFVAREGYVYVGADFATIEPKITAEICNEPYLINFFNNEDDGDLHALTAMLAFDLSEQPDKQSFERYAGKEINLGSAYGMGAAKLARKITLKTGKETSIDDAKKILDTYWSNIPNVKRKKQQVDKQIRQRAESFESLAPFKDRKPIAVLTNYFGSARRWTLAELEKTAREAPETLSKWYGDWDSPYRKKLSKCAREGYNFLIQSANAYITKHAAISIFHRFKTEGLDAHICALIHDEILVEVKEDQAKQAYDIVEQEMKASAQQLLKKVKVKLSIGIGKNWAEVH